MSIVDTDWKIFLSPDSEYPPDVCFLLNDGGDKSSTKTIRAHKGLLAGVSPFFRKKFFGPMKDEEGEIEVKDVTADAFQTLIDFIYRPPGQDTFTMDNIICPEKHFEVLQLADYYEVLELKIPVKKSLKNFVVTRENFQFSATVAMNNKDEVTFKECSVILSLRCLKFLLDTAKNPYDMSAVIEDAQNRFPGVSLDILLELKRVKDEKMPGNIKYCLV